MPVPTRDPAPTRPARSVAVLLAGYEVLPLGASLDGAGRRLWHAVPVRAFLIELDDGPVLIDAGLDPGLALPLGDGSYADGAWPVPPVCAPEHDLLGQLRALGLEPARLHRAVLTHLHGDHVGALRRLEGLERVLARPEALAAARAGEGAHLSASLAGVPWQEADPADPEAEPWPGLRLVDLPGHAPGHQGVRIDLPSGRRVLLAGDVADLPSSLDDGTLPGDRVDDDAARASLARAAALRALGVEIWLSHDPAFPPDRPLAPARIA